MRIDKTEQNKTSFQCWISNKLPINWEIHKEKNSVWREENKHPRSDLEFPQVFTLSIILCRLGAWALKLNERECVYQALETFAYAGLPLLLHFERKTKHQMKENWDVRFTARDRISRTGTLSVIGSEMRSVTPVIKERKKK